MPEADLRSRLTAVAVAAGWTLTELQLEQLHAYLQLLTRWNRKVNLTALPLDGFPDVTLARLIAEPLRAAALLAGTSGRWFDLGSGGGSPALPMRVVLTETDLTMVESRGRKVAFLREAAATAGLTRVEVFSGRIEELPAQALAGAAQLITARAVRIDRGVAATVRHLLVPSGKVVLFGGTSWVELAGLLSLELHDGDVEVLVPRGTSIVEVQPR